MFPIKWVDSASYGATGCRATARSSIGDIALVAEQAADKPNPESKPAIGSAIAEALGRADPRIHFVKTHAAINASARGSLSK